ncbi:MAG: peptidoglycan DD-metalloendopeptidase family protein [Chloroflexi bacterium]|nr:peptidoglycan DD-metalloendopeptidase family protein [Chloroflexota bacterium]
MLRLSEVPLSSRLGGWALIDSPHQRPHQLIAATGQQWSFAIAIAAALVAISAVIFDLRLSSQVGLPVVILPPAEAEPARQTAAQVALPPATTAPTETSGSSTPTATDRSPSATSSAEGTATPAASTPAARQPALADSASSETSAVTAALTETSSEVESSAAATEIATLNDPAARIRDYLGLHAGAQLPVSFSYVIEQGDTASSIAKRFGLQEATVLFNNFDIYDPNLLSIGQSLTLPPVDGLVYTVQSDDLFDVLMERYQGDRAATLAYPANGISNPNQIFAGQKLLLVQGSASVASSGVSDASSGGQGAQVWTVPAFVLYLRYDKISDYFGTPRGNAAGYHTGVDFIAPVGELVGAAAPGRISVATWDPSYGNWVEIDHGGGYRSRYAHLDIINVREGQWVDSGSYIGTVGNTGNSSGSHLHFEIIVDGQAVNPLAWLN